MKSANFKSLLEELYTGMMEESYEQLKANGFTWPEDVPLSHKEKVEFLTEMIDFYKTAEEFEKCEEIYKMQQSLV